MPTNPDSSRRFVPRGKWSRRLFFLALACLLLVLLLRVAMIPAIPWVLDKVAGQYGGDCQYERLEVSLLTGDVELWHLTFEEHESPEANPLFHLEYARVDVAVTQLLLGKLVVHRLEVDGADVRLEIDENGQLTLPKATDSEPSVAPDPTPEDPEEEGEPSESKVPEQLEPPLRIDALRAQHLTLALFDHRSSPPQEFHAECSLRLSDLDSETRPTRLGMTLTATPLLDVVHLEGVVHWQPQSVESSLQVSLQGLHAKAAESLLEPFGLRAHAHRVDAGFELEATVQLQPETNEGEEAWHLSAELEWKDLVVLADNEPRLVLDQVRLNAPRLDPGSYEIAEVVVTGLRGQVTRTGEGRIRAAGFELVPVPTQTTSDRERNVEPSPEPSSDPATLRVSKVRLENCEATFVDLSQEPTTELVARIPNFEVSNLLLPATGETNTKAEWSGELSLPQVAETTRLSGHWTPGPNGDLQFDWETSGITLHGLAPYLHEVGLESTWRDGELAFDLEADFDDARGIDLRLSPLRATNQGVVTDLPGATVEGLQWHSEDRTLAIQRVAIEGTRCAIRRTAEGFLELPGLRSIPPAPEPPRGNQGSGAVGQARATPPDSAPSNGASAAVPRITISELLVANHSLLLEDAAVTPAHALEITNLGLEIGDLVIGGGTRGSPNQASLKLWLDAPQLFDSFVIEGTILNQVGNVVADLALDGNGLTLDALRPYWDNLGIAQAWQDAHLDARVQANFNLDSPGSFSAQVEEMVFAENQDELLRIGELSLENQAASPSPNPLRLSLNQVRTRVERASDGTLTVLGVQLAPPLAPEAESPTASTPGMESKAAQSAQQSAPLSTASTPKANPLTLPEVTLQDIQLEWRDAMVDPPMATRVTLQAEVEPAQNPEQQMHQLRSSLSVGGVVDELALTVDLGGDLTAPMGQLSLSGSGLQTGSLDGYLPPGITGAMANGQLQLSASWQGQPVAEGGNSWNLELNEMKFHDGGAPESFLTVDSLHAHLSRVDLVRGHFAVEALATRGVRTHLWRLEDGKLQAFGLQLDPDHSEPLADKADTPAASPTPASRSTAARPLPAISLNTLDIGLDELVLHQASGPPLRVADLRIRSTAPFALRPQSDNDEPPVEGGFEVRASASPAVEELQVRLALTSGEMDPSLQLQLNLNGLQGTALLEALPEIAESIDPTALEKGHFQANLDVSLRPGRSSAPFDLGRPFGLDARVHGVRLQDGEGPTLIGLESLQLEATKVDLAGRELRLRSVELERPAARLAVTEGGFEAGGVVWKTSAATESREEASPAPSPSDTPTAKPMRLRLDQLSVDGLDLLFEDRTADPPLVLPVRNLLVDVRGITSPIQPDTPPVQFDVLVSGVDSTHSAAEAVFADVGLSGKLKLHPPFEGWVRQEISGLRLPEFTGVTKKSGVELHDGMFESTVNMRFQPDGSLNAKTRFQFDDLNISEGEAGFLRKYLQLPAPVDVVVFAIKDQAGSIELPVDFAVGRDGISGAEIAKVAVVTLGKILGKALLSSPFRVTGAMGEMVLRKPEKLPPPNDTVTLHFEPGSDLLAGKARTTLDWLKKRLAEDESLRVVVRHEIGARDWRLAELRANPSPELLTELMNKWRQQQRRWANERSELLHRGRTRLATDREDQSLELRNQLVELDTRIAQVDAWLRESLDQLDRRSPHHQERRTRNAGLDLAVARLESVRSALTQASDEEEGGRISLRRPRITQPDPEAKGRVILELRGAAQ